MNDLAYKVWEKAFGNKEVAFDFAGREIHKSAYGDQNSKYRWDIHHIYPKAKGGSNELHNLIPAHIDTNREAGDKTAYTANGRNFEVIKDKEKTKKLGKRAYEIREK
ncbi:HNH endonuclease [Mycoplasmopsis citelli]|uniref:HNH nuclease domain-containing protein n=1 Tax=Mycoplasmopsis citelli TaxID=171281 RepID=A0A449B2L2_9BACT|nr:HNH endonuclease domain-containing protein [Mycoplasmopsis citelli]UUD36546.1 HNH endonuclease [Mycoplasmopsis citelli]VEU74847.1 Uncharacterised protein [Mycoplasmopsis citelli]